MERKEYTESPRKVGLFAGIKELLEDPAMTTSAGAAITGSYDPILVALSIVIAVSGSFAALDLAGRVTASKGWAASLWL